MDTLRFGRRAIWALVVCAAVVMIFSGFVAEGKGQKTAAQANEYFQAGQQAHDNEEYDKAIELFQQALEIYQELDNREGEASSLNGLGMCYEDLGEFQEAITLYREGLIIFQDIGDRINEGFSHICLGWCHLGLQQLQEAADQFELALGIFRLTDNYQGKADSLRSLGKVYQELGTNLDSRLLPQAIQYFEAAIDLAKQMNDTWTEVSCSLDLGRCYLAIGDSGQGIHCYEEAIAAFQDIGDRNGEAEGLNGLGNYYEDNREFQQAIDYYEQALAIYKTIGDRVSEAYHFICLGNCYTGLHDVNQAISYFEQARGMFMSLGDDDGEAESLQSMGRCYQSMSDYVHAIAVQREAVAILKRSGNRQRQAEALIELANYYNQISDFQKAVDSLEQALGIFHQINNLRGIADCLMTLGDTYQCVGAYERGIEYLESAYDLCVSIEYRQGEADCLLMLGGTVGHWLNDTQRSKEYLERALPILQEVNDKHGIAWCSFFLGGCYMDLGDAQQAIELTQLSLDYFTMLGDGFGKQSALTNLGNAYQSQGDYAKTISCLEQAVDIAQRIKAVNESWPILQNLGSIYRTLGQLGKAKERYEEAIQEVEAVFGGLEMEALQSSFFVRVKEVYEEYLDLLLQIGETGESTLSVAERCRARTFLDLVAENAEDVLKNVPEEGIRTGVVAPEVIDRDIHEVVASLPEDTVALEYFVTDNGTYVWGINKGVVEGPVMISHGRRDLMKKVITCRQRLEGTDVMVNRDLAELYDWLIRPVEDWLSKAVDDDKSVSHLIIIPSGPLYYLPFQALLGTSKDRSEQFRLIERYAVSYSPSLAMLKYAVIRGAGTSGTASFLGLADPDPGDPALRLSEAQDEANHVAALFNNAQVYVGKDATEPLLQQEAQQVRYVLIAAHGKFDPQHPMYSYLLLSPTQESDGKLNTYEVFGLGLQAQMVVLSACETLLPAMEEMKEEERLTRGLAEGTSVELTEDQLKELTRGDEVAGLTRAFIAAGAASVVSSLWSVPSEATTALMVSLYTHLKEGMSKAEALRAAQIEVMNTTGWTQPWYWAAFNLVGDWR